LRDFHKFFAASRHGHAKVEVGDEVACTSEWESLCHDHIRSDAYKGFGYSKVAELDDARVWGFIEERSFKVSCPKAHPRELATSEVLNKGHKDGPVRVFMLVVLLSDSEASEQLNPVEAKARDTRRRSAGAALHVLMDNMPVEDAAAARH
jgi:hypothetical protein